MADQQDSNDQNAENQASAPQGAPDGEQVVVPTPVKPEVPPVVEKVEPAVAAPTPEVAPAEVQPQPVPSVEQPTVAAPPTEGSDVKAPSAVPEFMKKDKEQPATQPEERMWALLAYIPLVSLVSLVMKPDSKFVKLHGQQGLLLVVIFFVAIFFYIIPFVGPVIMLLLHLMLMAIGIFSMYQAYIGNWWKIPVIGDIASAIPVDALTKVTRTAVMSEKVDEEKREEASQQAVEKVNKPEERSEQQPSPEQAPQAPKEPKESNDQPSG